jgi:hypothetical protein
MTPNLQRRRAVARKLVVLLCLAMGAAISLFGWLH